MLVLYSSAVSVPGLVWYSIGSVCLSVLSSFGLSVPGLMWLMSGCEDPSNSSSLQATVQLNPLKGKPCKRKALKRVLKAVLPFFPFSITFECKDKAMNIGWKGKVDQLVHSAQP